MIVDQTENIENISTSFDKMDDKMFFMKSLLTKISFPSDIKLDFENIHIAIAKNGGYLAFCKKHNAFIMENRNKIKDNVIVMCQDTSRIITIPFKIERDKIIVLFDFNEDEKLFCILNDGTIFKFDFTLEKPVEIPTGKNFRTDKIETAKFFEKGFTALTKDGSYNIQIVELEYAIQDINNLATELSKDYKATQTLLAKYTDDTGFELDVPVIADANGNLLGIAVESEDTCYLFLIAGSSIDNGSYATTYIPQEVFLDQMTYLFKNVIKYNTTADDSSNPSRTDNEDDEDDEDEEEDTNSVDTNTNTNTNSNSNSNTNTNTKHKAGIKLCRLLSKIYHTIFEYLLLKEQFCVLLE